MIIVKNKILFQDLNVKINFLGLFLLKVLHMGLFSLKELRIYELFRKLYIKAIKNI